MILFIIFSMMARRQASLEIRNHYLEISILYLIYNIKEVYFKLWRSIMNLLMMG